MYRGALVGVRGTVRRVEAVEPAENDAGVERLFRATLQPEGAGVWPITVYTLEAPPAVDDPAQAYEAAASGWFFKNLSYRWAEGVGVTPVILARRLDLDARPVVASSSADGAPPQDFDFEPDADRSIGRALLAELGVSDELLANVVDRSSLSSDESEAFYAVLEAVAETPATQLVRLAQRGLPGYAERQRVGADASRRDRLLADEVARLAAERRYSVAPLFGDGQTQRGELIVVDAIVRRVVRVEASADAAGVGSYYELEAFPEDSQNLPLVFCVRELPEGFPLGEAVRQPARLAGFFFKQWAYRTRSRRRRAASGGSSPRC